MCGEQAAITTPVRWCSSIASLTRVWPGSEHMYLYSVAKATPGWSLRASTTAAVSTVRAMFSPQ